MSENLRTALSAFGLPLLTGDLDAIFDTFADKEALSEGGTPVRGISRTDTFEQHRLDAVQVQHFVPGKSAIVRIIQINVPSFMAPASIAVLVPIAAPAEIPALAAVP